MKDKSFLPVVILAFIAFVLFGVAGIAFMLFGFVGLGCYLAGLVVYWAVSKLVVIAFRDRGVTYNDLHDYAE
jgi:hypothetical protein